MQCMQCYLHETRKVFAVSMEMKNYSYEKDLRVFILIAGVAFFKSASNDPIPPNLVLKSLFSSIQSS